MASGAVLSVCLTVSEIHLLDEIQEILVGKAEAAAEEIPHRGARESEPAHSLLELREGRSVVARVSARLRGVAGCVLNLAMQNEVDELIVHAASPPALQLPAPLIGLARSARGSGSEATGGRSKSAIAGQLERLVGRSPFGHRIMFARCIR